MLTLEIVREYNGLAIALEDRSEDCSPEAELLREFLRQHKDSSLVLMPTGGYHGGTVRPNFTIEWYVIRKRQEFTRYPRIRQFLKWLFH